MFTMYRVLSAFCFLGILLASATAYAQPALKIEKTNFNQSQVEIDFKAFCDGDRTIAVDKNNLQLYDEGIEVPDFTLFCPDSTVTEHVSISIVLDASGSMGGGRNAATKAGANALIDELDGMIDEASIIWFTSMVNVELGMTTNKTDLHDAVNALPASGLTAVWDGTWTGLQELILSGSNPSRAVVVLTDGLDNSSTRTPDEIIALAKRNRVEVFTIALGPTTPTELETIADSTNGKFYWVQDPDSLTAVFLDVYYRIQTQFIRRTNCTLLYTPACLDGHTHEVSLVLNNICGGMVSEQTSYTAPLDSATFSPLDISVGNRVAQSPDWVSIPMELVTPITPPGPMHAATFDVLYDTTCMTFHWLNYPTGAIWESVGYSMLPIAGGVRITTDASVQVDGNGPLCNLVFKIANVFDTTICPVRIENWQFAAGCHAADITDGSVLVIPIQAVPVSGNRSRILCPGDSTTISLLHPYDSYIWNTGATTATIVVTSPGDYFAHVMDGTDTLRSETVHVAVIGTEPKPQLLGDTIVCLNAVAPYDAMYDEGYTVTWSADGGLVNFPEPHRVGIQWDTSGPGKVTLYYGNGTCTDSVSIEVDVLPAPQPLLAVDADTLCVGDTARISVVGSYVSYLWSTGDTTASIFVTQPGQYSVEVTYPNGCTAQSGNYPVVFSPFPDKPEITQVGNELTCSVQGASYKWFKNGQLIQGAVTRTITITGEGAYQVIVANQAGCETSSLMAIYTSIGHYAPTLASSFSIAPNPSGGEFHIALAFEKPTAFSLRIVDITGREFFTEHIHQPVPSYEKHIVLGSVPPGMYFLMVHSGGAFDYRKVIVQQR